MRYIGAHVSSAGGHQNAVKEAEKYNINTIQYMPSAPMRWSIKEIADDQVDAFVEAQKGSSLEKVLLHGVYLINLARKEKQMFHLSKMSVVTYMNYAQKVADKAKDLDMIGVTFHPGSAKDLTPEEGIERISYGVNWILEHAPGDVMLLLESSAGAGNVMGDTLEELAAMREGVDDKERVGYVLDTQHMFVSGYDWVNDLEGIVDSIDKTLGLDKVKCFHLNDSMHPAGAHKDRHADLGEGEIGMAAISQIVNHPKLKDIPFILETPGLKSESTMKDEIEKLREIAK